MAINSPLPVAITGPAGFAGIWLVDGRSLSDSALAGYLPCLNSAEQQRYAAFLRPQRQRQFLIGRVLLRQLLASLLGVEPQQIALSERHGNAPLLSWPLPDLAAHAAIVKPYFSLSHSGPWVACALSTYTALGLDIEVLDVGRDFLALAQHSFDEQALADFRALPELDKPLGFYQRWSEQEARYKLSCNTVSAAMADPGVAGSLFQLAHPELSIALCSALPLPAAPPLVITGLPLLP
jgi:4'-phosphopantetheinyl transferase